MLLKVIMNSTLGDAAFIIPRMRLRLYLTFTPPRPYGLLPSVVWVVGYIVVQPTVSSLVPSEMEAKVVGEPPFNGPKNMADMCELL